MTDEIKPTTVLPPTVSAVIDQFTASLREDDAIPDPATCRLEKLLRQGTVPKADQIDTALFPPETDGEP